MIDLFDMQDNKFIQVSDQVGANILRFNNYANGGRYIPAKDFNRYFDPVEEPEPAKPEIIESPKEVVNEFEKPAPKPKATRKPKTNQKSK